MIDFLGPIDEEALRAILSRAVTAQNIINSDHPEDDLRCLRELDVRFVGRAAYVWRLAPDDDAHFARAQAFAEAAHAQQPTIVLQAAVFEAIYPGMDEISIPAWVFELLDEEPEERCFRYRECFGEDFAGALRMLSFGDGCQVPDISRAETRRWFLYRACRYIAAGYEALHLGQVHLIGSNDPGYAAFADLVERIRRFAAEQARRRWVLLDAHSHGIRRGGQLLFDLHSRPLSCVPDRQRPEGLILQSKGRSLGGRTPSGWECGALPTLIEIDNWGGTRLAPAEFDQVDRSGIDRWGYDDIAWFAHRPPAERDHWLAYNVAFLRSRDPDAYFQMPLSRLLGRAPVTRVVDGREQRIRYYRANRPSPACPTGFDQEAAIAALWAASRPSWTQAWSECVRHEAAPVTLATGQDSPEEVYLTGPLLGVLGGDPAHSWDPHGRLRHQGEGRYWRAIVLPWPGSWTFSINVGGTMTEVFRQQGLAGNPAYSLTTTEPNTELLLEFEYPARRLRALDVEGRTFEGLCA